MNLTSAAELPLKGIRIIAVEQYGAGPYGSLYLAQLGAEVIKVEPPGAGDVSRITGPHFLGEGDSHFFQTFNQNKKSIVIDLKSKQGVEVFHRLVQDSDAVSNNLRGDQPEKLGLDYAALGQVNEKIVCAHLSAYGRNNDRKSWPGYDYLMQAEAGFMHLTGEPDTPPARFGLSMVDFMTGVVCSAGLLAALLGVARGGKGGDVDVSLFDVALHQLSYPATWYLNEQHITTRLPRSAHPATVPCQLYSSVDGWVFVMAMTPKFWDALLAVLGRDDLAGDERFADVGSRRENREALTEILDAEFARERTAHWVEALSGKVPVAPVYDLPQALENPWLEDNQSVLSIQHPQRKQLQMLANPIRLNGARLPAVAAGSLGADTRAVLQNLGYPDAEIAALLEAGVVGDGA